LFHWCSLLLLCVQGIHSSFPHLYKILKINTSQRTLKESDIEEDWFSFSSGIEMASAVTLVLFINIFYLAFHEYNDWKIQFWHLGNGNTFNIEIIEWLLTSSPLILDEWHWAIIFEGLEFLIYILIIISINCWMVIRTSISTHCNFIHLPNFLFNRNHSHELQNILFREQK
jgi:hypothetical protein